MGEQHEGAATDSGTLKEREVYEMVKDNGKLTSSFGAQEFARAAEAEAKLAKIARKSMLDHVGSGRYSAEDFEKAEPDDWKHTDGRDDYCSAEVAIAKRCHGFHLELPRRPPQGSRAQGRSEASHLHRSGQGHRGQPSPALPEVSFSGGLLEGPRSFGDRNERRGLESRPRSSAQDRRPRLVRHGLRQVAAANRSHL